MHAVPTLEGKGDVETKWEVLHFAGPRRGAYFFSIYLTNPYCTFPCGFGGMAVVWITRMWHFSAMGRKKCVALIKSDAAVVTERNYKRCALQVDLYCIHSPVVLAFPTATDFFFFYSCASRPFFPSALHREERLLGNYSKQMTSKF